MNRWIMRVAAGCATLAALGAVAPVRAQGAVAFPDRSIHMIVPFAAAGTTDIVTRLVASCMSSLLGQPVVVENRGGAGGAIGTDAVAKGAPDGYMVALHTVPSAVLTSFLYHHLPYDVRQDFVAVSQGALSPNVLAIRSDIPARTLGEFIALMKAKPGGYSDGTSDPDMILHLSAALFTPIAGVEATHVPYRGEGPAINDMVAGQIDFMVNIVPALLPYVRDGRFRALAVTTRERAAILPEAPTVAEYGLPDYGTYIWYGIFAPAGSPAPLVERLADAAVKAVNEPDCRQRMTDLGMTLVGSHAAEFTMFWDRQFAY